jgi:hypothetical protein
MGAVRIHWLHDDNRPPVTEAACAVPYFRPFGSIFALDFDPLTSRCSKWALGMRREGQVLPQDESCGLSGRCEDSSGMEFAFAIYLSLKMLEDVAAHDT